MRVAVVASTVDLSENLTHSLRRAGTLINTVREESPKAAGAKGFAKAKL